MSGERPDRAASDALDLRLADIDRDDAIAEAICNLHGADSSRAGFLRSALLGSGALLAAFAAPASAASSKAGDVSILNYALTLEELQAAFYTEVERNKVLSGALKEQAVTVGAVERAHVKAFRSALGSAAIQRPHFDFGGATESSDAFRKTAVAFEDLAVAAYKGQAIRIESPAVVSAALGIHTVEARHAAWMRHLYGIKPAVNAFDAPDSKKQVLALVEDTGFVVDSPRVKAKRKPGYTG